ncbi:MAG: hypothetical protein ABEJ75_03500 [Candidatus Nanohaloarchaea archaeon]
MARNLSGGVAVLGMLYLLSAAAGYLYTSYSLVLAVPLAAYGSMLAVSGMMSHENPRYESVSLSLGGLGLVIALVLVPVLAMQLEIVIYIWAFAVSILALGMASVLLRMEVFTWFDEDDH